MTVKSQVKEIVHDVKRRISLHHKHHRGESGTSEHTFASDDTAYSERHSRPATPDVAKPGTIGSQPGSHLATPEHGVPVPVTPPRKRVTSFFSKLRKKHSGDLSLDHHAGTPEHEVSPRRSRLATPEPSSHPGTPDSSMLDHGHGNDSALQRVPSTPSRKHNVLHKIRHGVKAHPENHSIEAGQMDGASATVVEGNHAAGMNPPVIVVSTEDSGTAEPLTEDTETTGHAEVRSDAPADSASEQADAEKADAVTHVDELQPLEAVQVQTIEREDTNLLQIGDAEEAGSPTEVGSVETGPHLDEVGTTHLDPPADAEKIDSMTSVDGLQPLETVQVQTIEREDTSLLQVPIEDAKDAGSLTEVGSVETDPYLGEVVELPQDEVEGAQSGTGVVEMETGLDPSEEANAETSTQSQTEVAGEVETEAIPLDLHSNAQTQTDDEPTLLTPVLPDVTDSDSHSDTTAVLSRSRSDTLVSECAEGAFDSDSHADGDKKSFFASGQPADVAIVEEQVMSIVDDHDGSSEGEQAKIASQDLHVNKPTPALPQASSTPTPAPATSSSPMYYPRLTAPNMFLPIPNIDPLSAMLTKHVAPDQRPKRDVAGEWTGREVHAMVMTNSWRALAKMARDLVVESDPHDLPRILDLWSLRLSALARLRLTNQVSAECTNLFAVLDAAPPGTSMPMSTTTTGAVPTLQSRLESPAREMASPAMTSSALSLPHTPVQRLAGLPGQGRTGTPDPHRVHVGQGMPVVSSQSTSVAMLGAYPFELAVLRARVRYWAGDARGYVDALAGLLAACKKRARVEARVVRGLRSDNATGAAGEGQDDADEMEEGKDNMEEGKDDGEESERPDTVPSSSPTTEPASSTTTKVDALFAAEAELSMWVERAARVCLILASQLVEMREHEAALALLTPLCCPKQRGARPSPALHAAAGRLCLLVGDLARATGHFRAATECASVGDGEREGASVMGEALMAVAVGDWERAEVGLRGILERDPQDFTAMNNLVVALLAQGRVSEGIEILESAIRASPASVLAAEPFIFNLATLYELRSTTAMEKKRALLVEVARWSGDGLKVSCLKMPSS